MELYLHNSLSGEKERFVPLDAKNIGMYVCGPTVYDRPHVGNGRAVVVYDVLFRLLQDKYSVDNVNFIRNITDVDDKINAKSKETGKPISDITQEVTEWFHEDMAALGNLPPSKEPKATEHIAEIITLVERIIANGHAYESDKHVLFDVQNLKDLEHYFYGKLSGKRQEDLIAGARIEVESYKRHASDFVLWKPSTEDEPGWDSPWGKGRPGWHIECSAMSTAYLGDNFDIHGGGADLKFPHHENEIAQSCCANPGSSYAQYWIHNGFVTVGGEKMSKSLGNFTTVKDLLDKDIRGEVVRYVLLATHYRKPLDFNDKALSDAKKNLDTLYGAVQTFEQNQLKGNLQEVNESIKARSNEAFMQLKSALYDDMNTPKALSELYVMAKGLRSLHADSTMLEEFKQAAYLLGLLYSPLEEWFTAEAVSHDEQVVVETLITQRADAKAAKDWAQADAIRDELASMGIVIKDTPNGTEWEKK